MELEEYVQMKDMFRSQREEAEREFELARAEEEEMSEIKFKSTFFLGHPVWRKFEYIINVFNERVVLLRPPPPPLKGWH